MKKRNIMAKDLLSNKYRKREVKPKTTDYFHSQLAYLNVSKIRARAFDHFINGFSTTHTKAKLKAA